MKQPLILLAYGLVLCGVLGIGAWLVVQGHPWFGLLVIIIGSSVSFQTKRDE